MTAADANMTENASLRLHDSKSEVVVEGKQ